MPTYKGEKDVDFQIDWYCDTVRLSPWNWNSSSGNMDKWEEGTAIEIKDNKMFLKYQKEGYLKVLLEYKDSVFTTINVLNYPHHTIDYHMLDVYWTTLDDFTTEKDIMTVLNLHSVACALFYDPASALSMKRIYTLTETRYLYEYFLQIKYFFDNIDGEWKLKDGIKTIISLRGSEDSSGGKYKWPYSQELPLKYLQLRRVKNPFDRDAFFERGIPFIYGDALVFDGLVVPEKVVYYTAPPYIYSLLQNRTVMTRLDYKFEE